MIRMIRPVWGSALAAAVLLAGVAHAQKAPGPWRIVGFNESRNGSSLLMASTATRPGPTPDTRIAITLSVFDRGGAMAAMEMTHLVDCATVRSGLREVVTWQTRTGSSVNVHNEDPQPAGEGSLMGVILSSACSGDFAGLAPLETRGPFEEAAFRFGERDALSASLGGTGWHKVASTTSDDGDRSMLFADKASLRTDARGRRIISVLLLSERFSGAQRYHVRMRYDCAARTDEFIYEEGYDKGRRLKGEVGADGAKPIAPDSFSSQLAAAVCDGDWGDTEATDQSAEAIAAEAFAP